MKFKIFTLAVLTFFILVGCSHQPQSEKVATIIHSKVSLKKASLQNYERLSESSKLAFNEVTENKPTKRPLNQFVETKVPVQPPMERPETEAAIQPEVQISEIKTSNQPIAQQSEPKPPAQTVVKLSDSKFPVQPAVLIPDQPVVQVSNQTDDAKIYQTASPYAGYEVEIFDTVVEFDNSIKYIVEIYDTTPLINTVAHTDPSKLEFGKLNGESSPADWRDCESSNSGYLLLDDNDLLLSPQFEVCMRNKGYVLSTEYNAFSQPTLSAATVVSGNPVQLYSQQNLDDKLNLGNGLSAAALTSS